VRHGLPKLFWLPLLSQERVKLTTSNLAGSIRTKAHKKLEKVAVGVVRESEKFSGHPYRLYMAHRAFIFAIAQLFCSSLVNTSFYVLLLSVPHSLLITDLFIVFFRILFISFYRAKQYSGARYCQCKLSVRLSALPVCL